MNALILVTALFTTFPNPDGSYTAYPDSMPPPQSPISRATQVADAFMVGQGSQYQRPQTFSYDELEERFPVRTRGPQYTVPIEEEMAMDAYQTERARQEVDLRSRMLNERIARNQFDYDKKILEQAERATGLLGELNPQSPDYLAQKAKFQEQFPLAVQNPAFNSQLGRLDQTHSQWTNDQDVLKRYEMQRNDMENERGYRDEQRIQEQLAQYGPGALDIYEKSLAEDRANNRPPDIIRAFANASQAVAVEQARRIQEKPLTPQQEREYRFDLIKQRAAIIDRRAKAITEPGDDGTLEFLNSELDRMGVKMPAASTPSQSTNFSQYEGKVIRQGNQAFRVTNGVPVPIK